MLHSGTIFADNETTGEENLDRDGRVRVWAWRAEDVDGDATTGTSISTLLDFFGTLSNKTVVYFHNLKFDFAFIETYLIAQGFKQEPYISHTSKLTGVYSVGKNWGTLYYVDIRIGLATVRLVDSQKMYPMSIAALGELVDLPKLTGDIDYTKYRPLGYTPTRKEWNYLAHDVSIMRLAFTNEFDRGDLLKHKVPLTRSSLAFRKLKGSFPSYRKTFPDLSAFTFSELFPAYAGGQEILNPRLAGHQVGKGFVLDKNSMYPSQLLDKDLPCGYPEHHDGKYKYNPDRPLAIIAFKAIFSLKKTNKRYVYPSLPTKFGRGSDRIISSDDLRIEDGDICAIYLTNFEFKDFLRNYDVSKIIYLDYWDFESIHAPFSTYIKGMAATKVHYTKAQADPSLSKSERQRAILMRAITKLSMNAAIGKFGQRPRRQVYQTTIAEDGTLQSEVISVKEQKKAPYLPLGIFIMSYARCDLNHLIYEIGAKKFIFAHTDSVHCLGTLPKKLEKYLDASKLGFWKVEETFSRGVYRANHAYSLELNDGTLKTAFSGLSGAARLQIKKIGDIMNSTFVGNDELELVAGGALIGKVTKVVQERDLNKW